LPAIANTIEHIQIAERYITNVLDNNAIVCDRITNVLPAIANVIENIQIAARYIKNVLYDSAIVCRHIETVTTNEC
jgi:hypothetical protein